MTTKQRQETLQEVRNPQKYKIKYRIHKQQQEEADKYLKEELYYATYYKSGGSIGRLSSDDEQSF